MMRKWVEGWDQGALPARFEKVGSPVLFVGISVWFIGARHKNINRKWIIKR